MQQELSLSTVPSQFPKLSRAGRVGFHTSDPVVYVIWKQLKSWAGILPWHMAYG